MPIEIVVEGSLVLTDEQARLLFALRDLTDAGRKAIPRIRATGHYEQALAFLVGFALANGEALHILCAAGRANLGRPTARTMVESVINAHYIAGDPDTRAARFWAFRPIPHWKSAEAVARIFGTTENLDELRKQAAAARSTLGSTTWAQGSIRSRAEDCGLLPLYDIYYQEGSAFTHGDASTWDAFAAEDSNTIDFGPSAAGIEAVVPAAVSALFGGLALLGHVFRAGELNTELVRIASTFPTGFHQVNLKERFASIRRQPRAT
jgi:hypothetical protein